MARVVGHQQIEIGFEKWLGRLANPLVLSDLKLRGHHTAAPRSNLFAGGKYGFIGRKHVQDRATRNFRLCYARGEKEDRRTRFRTFRAGWRRAYAVVAHYGDSRRTRQPAK